MSLEGTADLVRREAQAEGAPRNSLFSEVGAGWGRETGTAECRLWSLECNKPGLVSQLCCVLAVSPWLSFFSGLALFPHLQNGVKVPAAPDFSSGRIEWAIYCASCSCVLATTRMRLARVVGMGIPPVSALSQAQSVIFDPGGAEDAFCELP